MNIYARFFDQDTLVHSVEELFDFLDSIPEIRLHSELMADIRSYVMSDMPYPKRYKIRPRVYFILIKTTAETMEDFKANRKSADAPAADGEAFAQKEQRMSQLSQEAYGWYRGDLMFKRVVLIPATGKFQYQPTQFSACVHAYSGKDCYDQIVSYLRSRIDVDGRSQFPSVRGNNFQFAFLGEELPQTYTPQA